MAGMIDPQLFEQLKAKIDEDTKARDDLSHIIQKLERDVSYAQGLLSRVHSTPRARYGDLISQVEAAIKAEIDDVVSLRDLASNYPYYNWIGGSLDTGKHGEVGRLLTLEEVGDIFKVPVNLKDRDAFHITIEEYLMAITSLTDELSRLAVNSVTLGDNELAVKISNFVKDMHAGFQLLNLKNDILRKKVDGVKYAVKKVEDVVYDLSLRNLIPQPASTS
ncbi:putative translin family protein [Phaeoacremonium minimum UCRPA7]|uniref:Putative translin family protein n=1 Tax=Phaeoacremonium minimum (strain UCR-PA7) TaxID=1286976 RepID=R8BU55_PHAM7|nr:putative translin family protein [Phaeoacremonium minimum UCRPA7]EOO02908.1 putative translin family protein [Phaeoacremonium minimum UCRPA7]